MKRILLFALLFSVLISAFLLPVLATSEPSAEAVSEESESGLLSVNGISREASIIISIAVVFIMALAAINLKRKK
ncbi:MAG: hypothetical protein IJY88_06885 [Clostridia bacterium]|nr:hypothetical protein [Clostridia bacterium]